MAKSERDALEQRIREAEKNGNLADRIRAIELAMLYLLAQAK